MKIVAISDTHSRHHALKLPQGDLLIHAGDLTMSGTEPQVIETLAWLEVLKPDFPLGIIIIAGNHDWLFERNPERARELCRNSGIIYLQDSGVEINKVKFFGSPWQPWFCDWAFNVERGPDIKSKWDLIPEDTDVLITHGPPLLHCDKLECGERVGCEDPLNAVRKVKPIHHFCGHIHSGYGSSVILHNDGTKTAVTNASICNEAYQPVNKPFCFHV